MAHHELTQFVGPPERGRRFTAAMRPGLADCAPSGRMRLDALARWLQDIAYADVEDAGLADAAVWVVRRTRICVRRFPRFGEHYDLVTFCSGLGRMWAERRTTLTRADGADGADSADGADGDVEAVALWVHLDPESWRPIPFSEREVAGYGEAADGRRVNARLRHPQPKASENGYSWRFRATECDVADHVNNAAYWQPLEEELLRGAEPEQIDVQMEFRTPSQPGEKRIVSDGRWRWIVSPEGETHASILVAQVIERS